MQTYAIDIGDGNWRVMVCDAGGGNERMIAAGRHPRMTQDGLGVIYTDLTGRITIYDLATSAIRVLPPAAART